MIGRESREAQLRICLLLLICSLIMGCQRDTPGITNTRMPSSPVESYSPSETPGQRNTLVENPDPEAIAEGKVLYYNHCADCHERDIGSHEHPEAQGPSLAKPDSYTRGISNEAVFKTIYFGLEGTAMSPFGETLSESEIRLLVDYLKSVRASNPG